MFCYPIGTRVRLASGGPVMMVVDFLEKEQDCLCSWRDDGGVVQERWFKTITLDIVRNRFKA